MRRVSPLLTLGPIGYLPAPGTMASLAGAALFLAAREALPASPDLRLAAGVAGVSFIAFLCVAALLGKDDVALRDPREMVLDEVAGVWLALLPLMLVGGHRPLATVVGVALFRLLDIAKPSVIGMIDRRGTALSAVMDDLAAGAVAAVGTLAVILAEL